MREIVADPNRIAYCGLYCGACKAYLKNRCSGCQENAKAHWCKVRTCCIKHSYLSCADCKEHDDPRHCPLFNNLFSKVMALVFNSNRPGCILKIRELSRDGYAAFMAERQRHTLPRRRSDLK